MKSYDTDAWFEEINKLPNKIQKKLYRTGLQKAGLLVKADMQRRLWPHKRSGTLESSIVVKKRNYPTASVAIVGVQSNFVRMWRGHKVIAHKIAHFVTNPRKRFLQEYPKNSGRHRWIGANTPDNFIIKSEQAVGELAARKMGEVINDAIRPAG